MVAVRDCRYACSKTTSGVFCGCVALVGSRVLCCFLFTEAGQEKWNRSVGLIQQNGKRKEPSVGCR